MVQTGISFGTTQNPTTTPPADTTETDTMKVVLDKVSRLYNTLEHNLENHITDDDIEVEDIIKNMER